VTRTPPIAYALQGQGPAVLLLHGLGGDRNQSLGLLPDDVPGARLVTIPAKMPDPTEHQLALQQVLRAELTPDGSPRD
jgi:predicted esterase